MSGLVFFRCCEHCLLTHVAHHDEHVYRCYETDDGEPCEQGNRRVEATS